MPSGCSLTGCSVCAFVCVCARAPLCVDTHALHLRARVEMVTTARKQETYHFWNRRLSSQCFTHIISFCPYPHSMRWVRFLSPLFFLAAPLSMWDLSSLNRSQTCAPCTEVLTTGACVPSCFSRVRFFPTLWTAGCQASLLMGFSRQEYWSKLLRPPPGDLPNPGMESASLTSPALAGGFFTASATGEVPRSPILQMGKLRLLRRNKWI